MKLPVLRKPIDLRRFCISLNVWKTDVDMDKKTLTKQEHQEQYSEFTAALKEARLQVGLTQSEVANLLGRSQDWVSRCETGEHRVDIVELAVFLKVYKREVSFFLKTLYKASRNT